MMAVRLVRVFMTLLMLTQGVIAFPAQQQQQQRRGRAARQPSSLLSRTTGRVKSAKTTTTTTVCFLAQVTQQEAQKGIDKVVAVLRRDKSAANELGKLEKVTTVLGYGRPKPGTLAVRFNASFRKGGMGRSSVPLPFGLGQSNEAE